MAIHDDLGTRMKTFYEDISKTKLMRKVPVAIRIDGKAFHTFTRKFNKPFDDVLIKAMQNTVEYLCKNIQGCVLGYTQSDEITLILKDYERLESSAWFDYEVQKLCSISASMATMAFNKFFKDAVDEFKFEFYENEWNHFKKENKLIDAYNDAIEKGAMFDARCFNIPINEVTNLIYWRQLDATRNSIQMVAHANFSHKELQGFNSNQLQNKLLTEKDINWNNFPTYMKRGTCCIKTEEGWKIDLDIPIFKDLGREYIEKLVRMNE